MIHSIALAIVRALRRHPVLSLLIPFVLVVLVAKLAAVFNQPTFESRSTLTNYVLVVGGIAALVSYAASFINRKQARFTKDFIQFMWAVFGGAIALTFVFNLTAQWVVRGGSLIWWPDMIILLYCSFVWALSAGSAYVLYRYVYEVAKRQQSFSWA